MASGSPLCSRSPRLPGSGPRQLGQVEISPFKPARANQGLARPAVPTRGAAGLGSRPPGRRRRERGGTAESAAWVTCSYTATAWGQALLPWPQQGRHGALPAPRLPREPARPPELVLLSHHLW